MRMHRERNGGVCRCRTLYPETPGAAADSWRERKEDTDDEDWVKGGIGTRQRKAACKNGSLIPRTWKGINGDEEEEDRKDKRRKTEIEELNRV